MNQPIQTTLLNNNNQVIQKLFKKKGLNPQVAASFRKTIYNYYKQEKRSFPWRSTITPYTIFVSEVMLQQTQTHRVWQKFEPFIKHFPDFHQLASSPFEDILRLWKGLGYNRRALNLQRSAQQISRDHNGVLPQDPNTLVTLPGIGKATACSIYTFAFNKPSTFIETNIRTVFIYFFYQAEKNIDDKELMPLIEKTLDQSSPREWYYALMDYGVMLKKTVGNLSRLSKHYAKQSRFEGSNRQIRGKILEILLNTPGISEQDLIVRLAIQQDRNRAQEIIQTLCNEGLIEKKNNFIYLSQKRK